MRGVITLLITDLRKWVLDRGYVRVIRACTVQEGQGTQEYLDCFGVCATY